MLNSLLGANTFLTVLNLNILANIFLKNNNTFPSLDRALEKEWICLGMYTERAWRCWFGHVQSNHTHVPPLLCHIIHLCFACYGLCGKLLLTLQWNQDCRRFPLLCTTTNCTAVPAGFLVFVSVHTGKPK